MKNTAPDNSKAGLSRGNGRLSGFFLKVLRYLLISMFMAAVCYLFFALFFETDQEKRMIRENEELLEEYTSLEEKLELVDGVISDLVLRDRTIYNDVFNCDPPKPDMGKPDSVTFDPLDLYKMHETDLVWDAYAFIGRVSSKVYNVSKWLGDIEENLASKGDRTRYIPATVPVRGFTVMQTGASKGLKYNPFLKAQKEHNGIDIMAPTGTEVLSSAAGTVVAVEKKHKGMGSRITIDHGNGIRTTYSHLSATMVNLGRRVERGTVIGRVGNSGTSFAPCLHYEVIRDGNYQDPINYFFADLDPEHYREMAIIAQTTGQSMD